MKLGTFVVIGLCLVGCGDKRGGAATTPAPPDEPVATEPAEAEAAAPAFARPTSFQIEDNALVLPGPVRFETGTATLHADAEPALVTIQAYLEDKSYITTMRIEGHVRDGGASAQALSEARALAVTAWLVAHGVDCQRLLPVGFGDTKPRFGDAQDNRIEAVNAALRGRLIGGMPADGGGRVAGDPCAQ